MATIKLIGDAPNQVSRNKDLGSMAHVDIAEANGYIVDAAPSATTPLAGTEELAVVQSGDTKKVSVANLTAGRSVSASELTVDGTGNKLASFTNNIGTSRPSSNVGVFLGRNASGGFNESNIIWGTGGAAPAFRIQSWNGTTLTNQFALDTSGNAYLDIGNLVIGTSGKGIDFSATGNAAGMTSELLDDYEEGTWTPTPNNYDGTSVVEGYYTKIGNMCFASFYIELDGTSDGSTFSVLLPFASFNGTNAMFGSAVSYTTSTATGLSFRVRNNNSEFRAYNNSGTELTYNTFGASAVVSGTIIFRTN